MNQSSASVVLLLLWLRTDTVRGTRWFDFTSDHLAGCYCRSRNGVVVEVGVDVGSVAWISSLDVSRDLDGGRQDLRATASHLDLSARDVELRRGAGVVDGKLLNAEQVLASSKARRDGDRVAGCACVSFGCNKRLMCVRT